MFSKIEELPEKLKEKFVKDEASAHLSKKLATIVRDVPVPEFSIDNCALWKLDSFEGIALFEEYGFKTLTKRMEESAKLFVNKNQLPLL
jgi:DNA polymerase-1